MVRLGRQPVFASSATARASSSTATMPLTGSVAPKTQPSWWLPRITHWSGSSAPGSIAMTSCAGARSQSNSTLSRTVAGPGPRW